LDPHQVGLPKHVFKLQLFGKDNDWHDWGSISANGRTVGRSRGSANFPGLRTMAEKHLRFSYHRTNLFVEDLGSLNGVYVRITEPMVLSGGSKFRIGKHILEFHVAEPTEPVEPRMSDDQEEFSCRDLEPLAFLS